MALREIHHTGVIVADLPAAIRFFETVGFDVDPPTTLEGPWVDAVNGIPGSHVEMAMASVPGGGGRIEITRFVEPADTAPPEVAASNRLGIRHLCCRVDDLDAVLADLRELGYDVLGEVVDYGDVYRLCYVRGPEGMIVEIAHELGGADS